MSKKLPIRNPFEKKEVHLLSEDLRRTIKVEGNRNGKDVRKTEKKEKIKSGR